MNLRIQDNVSLQDLNTLGTPATAQRFFYHTRPEDLPAVLALARESAWPVRVLGDGSNVVLASLLDGLLIQQGCRGIELIAEDAQSVVLAAAGGENWHDFVQWCLQRGYYGLENLALIPGTVGAAPIQNIGAYGVEVAAFVESVRCRRLDSGDIMELAGPDCRFSYRESIFKQELCDKVIVEEVRFKLSKTANSQTAYPVLKRYLEEHGWLNPDPQQVFKAVVAIRSARLPDPYEIPNAGSFFKNPQVSAEELARLLESHPGLPHYPDKGGHSYKLAAAWLIEQCGFKSRTEGPVQVHPDHALVIINPQRRPAHEIESFAKEIVEAVELDFGLLLEQEPRSYG